MIRHSNHIGQCNMITISRQEFEDFKQEYYGGPLRLHERFGQAFLNRFYPHLEDYRLYYNPNNEASETHIKETYIF